MSSVFLQVRRQRTAVVERVAHSAARGTQHSHTATATAQQHAQPLPRALPLVAALAGAAAEADECRIWLKHVQGFVMQQSRQVQATLSGAPGSALSTGMWRSACLDASEVLARIADELAGGASSSSVRSRCCPHLCCVV